MNKRYDISQIDLLKKFFDPQVSVPLFILGTATLTTILNALYNFVREKFDWLGVGILVFCLFVVLLLIYNWLIEQIQKKQVYNKSIEAPFKKGIFVSVSREDTVCVALDHHLKQNSPLICWFVVSPDTQSIAETIKEKYRNKIISHEFIVIENLNDHLETYSKIKSVIDKQLIEYKITEDEMVLDITGMTKPVCIGMVKIGQEYNIELEYVPGITAGRDLRPIISESYPIKI